MNARYLLVLAAVACGGASPTGSIGGSVVNEPGYDATATMVYQDDMNSYISYTAMWLSHLASPGVPQIAPADGGTDLMSIVTGRGGSGKALRISYPGGAQTGEGWNTWATPHAPDMATHYIQYWARVTFSAPLTSTLGVKWLEGWHRTTDRIQWSMHWANGTCPEPKPIAHNTYWQAMDKSQFSACQGAQPVGPYLEDVIDGQWHRFTVQYRPNTSTGARNGVARMWIDGVKMLDVSLSACGVTPPGGEKPWCALDDIDKLTANDGIYFLKLGGIQTTVTPAWTLDIDDLRWWTR